MKSSVTTVERRYLRSSNRFTQNTLISRKSKMPKNAGASRPGWRCGMEIIRKVGFYRPDSSAWLEHYTDNVGVSSSNLLGSTLGMKGRMLGRYLGD